MAKQKLDGEDDTDGLTILGALEQLRDDIAILQESNRLKDRKPLFQIEGGELELKLVAKRDTKTEGTGKAKFRLWVVDVDAGAGRSVSKSTESLQTLKIRFKGLETQSANVNSGMGFPGSDKVVLPTGAEFNVDPNKIP